MKVGSQVYGEAVSHLDPRPEAPARARDFLAEFAHVHDGAAEDCLTDGVLVVSELVANAVWHAATPPSVHLTVTTDHLEVAVQDRGPGRPRVPGTPTFAGQGMTTRSVWSATARGQPGLRSPTRLDGCWDAETAGYPIRHNRGGVTVTGLRAEAV